MSPNAKIRGKTFESWSVIAAENAVKLFVNAGGDSSLNIKKVLFLPVVPPDDADGSLFEYEINVRAGTAFCINGWQVFGEIYDNGMFDDPRDPSF